MEPDPGNRQPDRDKEPVNMDTFIDRNLPKTTVHVNGEHRDQTAEPAKKVLPDLAPALEQQVVNNDPTGEPEQTAPNPPKLHFTQDVLSLYGLQPLVATIARTDPVTGQKINKLRKSYEGHLKAFKLAGKNKSENAKPEMKLLDLIAWPEEEYYNQRIHGKDLNKGLQGSTVAKLDKAFRMRKGPTLPDNDIWEERLGLNYEKVKPPGAIADKKGKATATSSQTNGQVNGNRSAAAIGTGSVDSRPKRAGAKRTYQDASFEGYGGYADGAMDDNSDLIAGDDGYSSEEHSRRGSASKRRKKSSKDLTATSPAGNDRGRIGIVGYAR